MRQLTLSQSAEVAAFAEAYAAERFGVSVVVIVTRRTPTRLYQAFARAARLAIEAIRRDLAAALQDAVIYRKVHCRRHHTRTTVVSRRGSR